MMKNIKTNPVKVKKNVEYQYEHQKDPVNGNADASVAEKSEVNIQEGSLDVKLI